MRTFFTTDQHGCLEQLKEAISKAGITREDRIVFGGDYIDRGPDSYGVIEYCINLAKNQECIFLNGNHDDYWKNSLIDGKIAGGLMWKQGAKQTFESYFIKGIDPEIHLDFFKNLLPYFVDEELNCFVHGGFNRHAFIENQNPDDIYWWDRDLVHSARSWQMMGKEGQQYKFKIKGCQEGKFKEIFVGHTPVQYLTLKPSFTSMEEGLKLVNHPLLTTPQQYANIWVCDTGAGKYVDGKVTVMNVQTKEFFQA